LAGELEKALELLAFGSCSLSISRSPKLPIMFLFLVEVLQQVVFVSVWMALHLIQNSCSYRKISSFPAYFVETSVFFGFASKFSTQTLRKQKKAADILLTTAHS